MCNVFLLVLEGQVPILHGVQYGGLISMKQLHCTLSDVLLLFLKCKQKYSMEETDQFLEHIVNSER